MVKNLTEAALTAKEIRKVLKAKFPETKFKVTSHNFAGGDSVHISWINGPKDEDVDKLVRKYQYGHFNGMIDYYEYSNVKKDMHQVKFVQTEREFDQNAYNWAINVAKNHYSELKDVPTDNLSESFIAFGEYWNWYQLAWKILRNLDLTNALGIIEDPDFETGTLFEGFKVVRNNFKDIMEANKQVAQNLELVGGM